MKIRIYDTITHTLGFAVRRFETVARLGWLPLLLAALLAMATPYLMLSVSQNRLIGPDDVSLPLAQKYMGQVMQDLGAHSFPALVFTLIGIYFLMTVLHTSALIPLLRLSARDEVPHQHSFSIHFGWAHLKYAVTSLLSVLGIGGITFVPLIVSSNFIAMSLDAAAAREYAHFPDADSLHRIDMVTGDETLAGEMLSAAGVVLPFVFLLVAAYLGVRFLAFPFLAALRDKSAGAHYSALSTSWSNSRGWNFLRMLVVALVLGLIVFGIGYLVNAVFMQMILVVLTSALGLSNSWAEVMAFDGDPENWTSFYVWVWGCLTVLLSMLYQFFILGIAAGLGGQLYRQFVHI